MGTQIGDVFQYTKGASFQPNIQNSFGSILGTNWSI